MSYDFTALKLVPIASVLRPYGVEVRKRSDKEFVCKCPLPSHKETEHRNDNPTFCISVEKNKWYCQSDSCRAIGNHPKGGDVLDLVCRLDCCDVKQAAKTLSELFAIANQKPALERSRAGEVSSGGDGRGSPREPHRLDNNTSIAENRNPPLAFTLKNLDPDHDAIRSRGISLETAMDFGVGYHGGKGSMANRVCFPLLEDGVLIGYAGRSVDGSEPKWKLPQGLRRTFLYGLERCDPSKLLHVTESCWGVLHLFQCGVQAAALIGTSLTEEQERLLDPFREIRICMDYDNAGREAADKLTARLKPKHKITKAFLKD